jgi:thiamine biosynthesis lipoprotein
MNPSRRDFLALGVGALAVASLPRALRRPERLVRRRIPVMGTVADVAVRHRDQTWAQRAIDAALAELRRVDRTMTRFRADSDVGRLNASAGRGPVALSEDTGLVLVAALAWAESSAGRFDPCLGRAAELWSPQTRREPPNDAEIRAYSGGGLWRALDVEEGRARLHDRRAAVDLGGIAKGFGVDAAARALRDHGVSHGLVNVGGDLVALGVAEDGEPWRIGVRSPEGPEEIVQVLEVSGRAVATSGDYLQYFEHRGRRYHHLLDPVTGAPRRTEMHSLTIEAESCIEADAAATTLFGASPAEARDLLSRAASGARIVHTL